MTQLTCCGGIDQKDSVDGPSETHPYKAPSETRNCYKDFKYNTCDECCEDNDTCMRTDWGGFCNSSSGMDYIYNDGNLHQLTDEDWKKYSNIKSRGDDHHSRERNRRTIRAAERDILNKMYEDELSR